MTALRPQRVLGEDHAVSPVIGMILVLAISIVGIAAILYWGLPAIDEMKANVEYRSTTSQFSELDSTIRELVAGTTEKTAKRWQPSISRGSITVTDSTEGWLYAADLYNGGSPVNLTWTGLADGDNQLTIWSRTTMTNVKVEASIVNGASSTTTLLVSGGTSADPGQMTGADLPNFAQDTSRVFKVYTTLNAAQPIRGETFHFKVFNGATLVAEAWYVDTGRVNFHLDAGVGSKDVVLNNGAVISGTNGAFVVTNAPSIPPNVASSGVTRFFGRALVFDGSKSVGGENRFDMLVSLYSTAALASYDCQLTTRADCVATSKIFVYGKYAVPWYNYLSRTPGYTYSSVTDASGQTYLYDRSPGAAPHYMAYTILESDLKVT